MEIVMTIEKAIELLQEDKENYIKASQCGLGYPRDNSENMGRSYQIKKRGSNAYHILCIKCNIGYYNSDNN